MPPNASPTPAQAPARQPPHTRQWLRLALVWAVVTLALLGVFALYRRPDFLMTLANQLWSCF